MTIKRIIKRDEMTKLLHEETKLAMWVGFRDTHIERDRPQASTGYVNSSREDFEALIELAQAAIQELDRVRLERISDLEFEIRKLQRDRAYDDRAKGKTDA